jgi:hypothetical protein
MVLTAGGCGSGEKKGAKVTGSVTSGSTPQASVTVGFVPAEVPDNVGSVATITDPAGKFETNLLPGKYKVIVSRMVDQNGKVPGPEEDVGQLEASGLLKQSFPVEYTLPTNTTLTADIPPEGKDLPPFEVPAAQ